MALCKPTMIPAGKYGPGKEHVKQYPATMTAVCTGRGFAVKLRGSRLFSILAVDADITADKQEVKAIARLAPLHG